MLEAQLAGLESLVQERGELDIVVSPPSVATEGFPSENHTPVKEP